VIGRTKSNADCARLPLRQYPSVTLITIAKAATAIGKKISINFDEMHSAKTA